MTVAEMRARLLGIADEERRLSDERYTLTLAIEEAEGRPESHAARFARAVLAHDLVAMNRLCAVNVADEYRQTGKWSSFQAEAERILADREWDAEQDRRHPDVLEEAEDADDRAADEALNVERETRV